MKQPILQLEKIVVQHFQQTILSDIDLSINEGDFIMLIGPNGSGKSTLLKVLNGTMKPHCGRMILRTTDLTTAPVHQIARHIATLTQDIHHSTFSDLTVEENLDLALSRTITSLNADEKKKYLADFSVTLKDRFHTSAGKLSGGQRQALALAMCFAHQPAVLLLDEHTSALDPKAASMLMRMTHEHIKRYKLTTIMITHNLEQVLSYGNRLIVLNEGRIAADIDADAKRKLTIQDVVAFAY